MFFFFKQKTAYEMRISDWSSDVCSSDLFDWIRQSYFLIADHLLRGVEAIEGVDPLQKEQLRFATRNFVDAMSPTNFPATNPQVLEQTIETRGAKLLTGLANLLADLGTGKLTPTDPYPIEVGRNTAATPGQ